MEEGQYYPKPLWAEFAPVVQKRRSGREKLESDSRSKIRKVLVKSARLLLSGFAVPTLRPMSQDRCRSSWSYPAPAFLPSHPTEHNQSILGCSCCYPLSSIGRDWSLSTQSADQEKCSCHVSLCLQK